MAAQLAAQRLRYVARAAQSGPTFLLALMQSCGGSSWCDLVISTLEWLQAVVSPKLDALGSRRRCGSAWMQLWTKNPSSWRGIIKEFLQNACGDCFSVPSCMVAASVEIDDDGEFLCIRCGQEFRTRCALAGHEAAFHRKRRWSRAFVVSGVCPVCSTNFHSRARCMNHLERDSLVCRQVALQGGLPELSPAEQSVLDKEDAAHKACCRRLGISHLQGPAALRPA